MKKLTPSRIREYLACPLQFKRKYLEALGPKEPEASPAFSFGSSMHASLDALHRPNRSRQAVQPETLLRRHWLTNGYADPTQEAEYFASGVAMLTVNPYPVL